MKQRDAVAIRGMGHRIFEKYFLNNETKMNT